MRRLRRSVTADRGLSTRWALVLGAAIFAWQPGAATADDFVPFAIPARINAEYPIWVSRYEPVTPTSRRIVVRDAHFARGETPVRIWGVNLSFAANFPTHQDAEAVAARLAAAGVNSVRCHHMDTSAWPNGIWDPQNLRTLSPEALDRLDYFINELAKRGIVANVNLHVGRAHSEYMDLPKSNCEYDKIVGIFTPALIEAQKTYARSLLTHFNPYRNARYADDAAVAFVEISNEDSLSMWDADETLRKLPPYYAGIFRDQFNVWLQTRYGSDEALRAAWARDTQPLGDNVLKNGDFASWDTRQVVPSSWNLEQHESCRAVLARPQAALRIQIDKADSTEWHLQFNQRGLTLRQGQYYTVSFEAASDQHRRVTCSVGQAHDPWNNLGLSRDTNLTAESKHISLGFVATADENDARVSFAFSGNSTPFTLTAVELRPGGQVGLAAGESLKDKSVALFHENESRPRILDRMIFLAETEKAYFDGMRTFIKKDLGGGALVTGTIVFGPLGQYVQSDMDYIDSHAYWQHPRFPNKPWDPADWYVEQKAMTDSLQEATLFELAAEKLPGKPFTVSEYNHPAPLDAQAECVPMIASFAASQDWDGIWLYTYSHTADNWSREYLNSYFDIDTNPAKWGFMRAGTAMFRDSAPQHAKAKETTLGDLTTLAKSHLQQGRNMLPLLINPSQMSSALDVIEGFISAVSESRPVERQPPFDIIDIKLCETNDHKRMLWSLAGTRFEIWTGQASLAADAFEVAKVNSPDFVALTVTPLDGAMIRNSQRILVTACGRCENTGMKFSADRRTVGQDWGSAPVRIEAVTGQMCLPEGRWSVHALAPSGAYRAPVPVTYENGVGTIVFSPRYETMWYLLEREEE
jgi:hypothetical protein